MGLDTFKYTPNQLANELGNYDTDVVEVGFSAQQINQGAPEITTLAAFDVDEDGKSKSGNNYLTMDYSKMTVYLTKALQEEVGKRVELESKVDRLEAILTELLNERR